MILFRFSVGGNGWSRRLLSPVCKAYYLFPTTTVRCDMHNNPAIRVGNLSRRELYMYLYSRCKAYVRDLSRVSLRCYIIGRVQDFLFDACVYPTRTLRCVQRIINISFKINNSKHNADNVMEGHERVNGSPGTILSQYATYCIISLLLFVILSSVHPLPLTTMTVSSRV